RCDLMRGGPEDVIQGTSAREFAAEGIERFNRAQPLLGRGSLLPSAPRKIGNKNGQDGEENEGSDVRRLYSEGEEWGQEKENIAERCGQRRHQRWQQPVTHRDADNGGQQHERDVLQTK